MNANMADLANDTNTSELEFAEPATNLISFLESAFGRWRGAHTLTPTRNNSRLFVQFASLDSQCALHRFAECAQN